MSLVITDDDSASFPVKSLNIDWSRVGDSNKEGMSVTAVERSEYAYMIYTSGTTGQPKGTPISQRSLLSLVNARQQSLPFDDHHVELCFGSISFDASVWSIYPVLLSGATVCLATDEQRHDPQQLLQVLQKERVSSVLLPPTKFTYLP
jgi:non-ribosomal peptide synthetase component F